MSRPVYKYSIDKEFICKYQSTTQAARDLGVDESTIRRSAEEDKRSSGFIWSRSFPLKNINFKETETNYYYSVEELSNSSKQYKKEKNNIGLRTLIIGDLHEPFTRSEYMDFCKDIYEKYKCNNVIFIGDLIDNHFSSFHETDPDGHSAAKELELAKNNISKWYKLFPKAKVCIGNHDLIPIRKTFNAGISKFWLRSISEVLDTPNWEYAEEFIIDNVLYVHGTGRKALNRMAGDLMSVIQGHYHSEGYINYAVGKNKKMFAMQLGCGVDDKTYAMAYGRFFDKMHINCGVVLENGTLPILEYMNL